MNILCNKLFLILGINLMLINLGNCVAATQTTFENLLLQSSKGGHYIAPTSEELTKAEALFRQMFRQDESNALKKKWSEIGFEWLTLDENGKEITVLREKEDMKLGRGFYAFQKSGKGNILEAPHTFSDVNTGEIAAKLFLGYNFPAAAWSTVPRKQADMAHLSSSYFMSFSRAFALEMPNHYLIQLHGFAQAKRKSVEAINASMVLSSGSKNQFPELLKMAACLKKNVSQEVRIYPTDSSELGATTNSIGKMFRNMNHENFIHIEMSEQMRSTLLESPGLLEKLKVCFPK